MNIKDGLIAATVIGVWGITFLFTKIALTELQPMLAGTMRFVLLLFPAIFFIKKPDVSWKWLALYGLTISFAQFALMFSAMALGMPTGLVALVLQSQVFFTVLLAALLFGEKITPQRWLAMALAAAGLGLIGVGQAQGDVPLVALLLMIASAFSWASGNLVAKKIGRVNALGLVVWGNVWTVAAFVAVSLMMYGFDGVVQQLAGMTWHGWVGVSYLAYIGTFLGYTGWSWLLARHPAAKIMPLAFLIPVEALLVGFAILDETLNGWHWAGILAVAAGLLVHLFGGRWQIKSKAV
ncbi:EamA family transporter [Neisseria lisongii]|uniref:EamA family transporter n=1 Tax=Neisseria lisongii TaxID=2912188 RepID=A0AAW5AP45_9NEIS|nr:EamA family transporter [Neisseria lisongii]MCF7530090.1 EamA family transporter [Neisseria lisongii]